MANDSCFRGTFFKSDSELESEARTRAAKADPLAALDALLARLGSIVTAAVSEKTATTKAPTQPAPAPKPSRVCKSQAWTFTRLKD